MDKATMKNLDVVALKKEIELLKKELFNLRLNMFSGQIKDVSRFKKLRIAIAQASTFLSQKSNVVKNESR